MDIFELKESIENLDFNEERFYERHIQGILKDCDTIHIIILNELYNDAKEKYCFDENERLNGTVCQSVLYSELLKKVQNKVSISNEVFDICLNDLMINDIILNVQRNTYKECSYGIRPLGLRCIKYINSTK